MAVNVECRSRRVGERRDPLEMPLPPAAVFDGEEKGEEVGARAPDDNMKLSGEKQTKNGVNLRALSFSR